jgi:type II secretory pathway component PulC
METLLRRHMGVVNLVVIAVCAALSAHAAATAIGGRLGGGARAVRDGSPARAPLRQPPAVAPPADDPVAVITRRNVFCSRCTAVVVSAVLEWPAPPSLRLLAIMFAPRPAGAGWSVAVIRDLEARTAGAYGVGARLGGTTVLAIEPARVVLAAAGGRRFVLELLDRASPPSAPPARAAPDGGIVRTGEHRYQVPRATVEALLGDAAALHGGPRVIPELRDGRPVGFRLFGVRADSPFGRIGLESGDVIAAVNGIDVTSVDRALEAYVKLRAAGHIAADVERAGRRITLEYEIQ